MSANLKWGKSGDSPILLYLIGFSFIYLKALNMDMVYNTYFIIEILGNEIHI